MNTNSYQKIVQAAMWYEDKIVLSKRLKPGFGFKLWSDAGGKVNEAESLPSAIQREVAEETGLFLAENRFIIVDSYTYSDRNLKTFIFEVEIDYFDLDRIRNKEPEKQSDWRLFSKKQALRLPLVPSIKYYLENLSRV